MKQYNFKYDIMQKVFINDLGISGYITALMVTDPVNKYLVSYMWDGDKREIWFYEFEIRAKK